MLGATEQGYTNSFLDWIKEGSANDLSSLELDVQSCKTATDCLACLTKEAHLILMNVSALISNEERMVVEQIGEFCAQHQIINLKSEKEMQTALGMMQKGIWDYIRPEVK